MSPNTKKRTVNNTGASANRGKRHEATGQNNRTFRKDWTVKNELEKNGFKNSNSNSKKTEINKIENNRIWKNKVEINKAENNKVVNNKVEYNNVKNISRKPKSRK
jgi:hypothetical protein